MLKAERQLTKYNPEFVKELLEAAKKPPERTFNSMEELLRWLDVKFECSRQASSNT